MKRLTLSALFLLGLTSIWAQEITCHIEGTTTDNETKNLILIEWGKNTKTQENNLTKKNAKINIENDLIELKQIISIIIAILVDLIDVILKDSKK